MICLSFVKKTFRIPLLIKSLRPGDFVPIFFKFLHIMDDQEEQISDQTSNESQTSTQECEEASTSKRVAHKPIRLAAVFNKPPTSHKAQICEKKPPMKTAQDVINRVKWDDSLSPDEFCVGYKDRFDGVMEKPFAEFDWETDISGAGPDIFCIPQHRIQYFKQNGTIVWDKEKRLDNVFGSTKGSVKIHDLNNDNQPDSAEVVEKDENVKLPSNLSTTSLLTNPDLSRPNCFVGFVVDSPEVHKSVQAYHRKLSELAQPEGVEQELKAACVPIEKLHVTFCVCTVNMEELQTVKKVTQSVFEDAAPFQVNFKGVGEFGPKIKYAVPDGSGLYQYGTHIQEKLFEAGINMQGNFYPYCPHLTLVKFRGSVPSPEITTILSNKQFKKWVFKHQVLNKVVICEIQSTRPDGFYNTLATYKLGDVQRESASSAANKSTSGTSLGNVSPVVHKKRHAKFRKSHNLKRDVEIGKALVKVLRHNKFGFKVDSGGYVEIKDILEHQHFSKTLNVSRDDIYRVVRTNDKKRFEIMVDTLGIEFIKATQGHSVAVEDLELEEITDPSEFPTVVHGTFWKFWMPISVQGLHRRNRIHIHMTTSEPKDGNSVISGMRKTSNLFIYVDIAAAMADGIRFFLSPNGVILSSGDDMGYLSPKYFIKVIGTSTRQRITVFDRENPEATVGKHFEETTENATDNPDGVCEQLQLVSTEDWDTPQTQ